MKETSGPMNGPHEHEEPKDEMKVEYGPNYDTGDDKYRSERKERAEKRLKGVKAEMKGMTPEKAHKAVMAGLEKAMKRCEIECMEYDDDKSVGDAYDE
jgi:hypothetical protein